MRRPQNPMAHQEARVFANPQSNGPAATYAGLNARYVRINKFAELTGYTDKAVRCKIAEGVWLEGRQYRRAPDGAILVDLAGYEQWVEGNLAPV
ncbi:hypothetical protein [Rhizomicrobium electricum]|uniref:Excisionase n=1 Tax=Rhizomicrobium electricum TaxID=480070 RepID=A0ABN1F7M6_9PROT|nr:hypothetical protein [Rhizomicrobium electricum]NIJ46713.1 hypothetical protein [Rhizomicrobium electricum]